MSEDQIIEIGFVEVIDVKNHIDEQISNGMVSKQLSTGRECDTDGSEEDNQNHFYCFDLKLLRDQ